MTDLTTAARAAVVAVRTAAVACRRVQDTLVTPATLTKKDRSPVTVADFASQAVVCHLLSNLTPEIETVAEEDAAELRDAAQRQLLGAVADHVAEALAAAGRLTRTPSSEDILGWVDLGGTDPAARQRYWTLDPIDGTKGFLRREQYAVALGLIDRGRVVMGVLGCPNLGRAGLLLLAREGQGTQALPLDIAAGGDLAGQPVKVSACNDAAAARFCESVESGHSDQDDAARIAAALGITAEPLRMDSQAKYATVARGDAEIYLRIPTRPGYEEKIWDHAAGALCVTEAGGKVTDIDGKPLDFGRGRTLAGNRGIVATCGPIHDQVLAAVRQTTGEKQ